MMEFTTTGVADNTVYTLELKKPGENNFSVVSPGNNPPTIKSNKLQIPGSCVDTNPAGKYTYKLTVSGVSAEVVIDLTNTQIVDKAALASAITAATAYKDSVPVGTDAASVGTGIKWALQADVDAYGTAITNATTVKNNANATAKEVSDALAALNSATATFKAAIKVGTKAAVVEEPTTTDTSGAGTATIGDASANDAIKASLKTDEVKTVISSATSGGKQATFAITLPASDKGTVLELKVPAAALNTASAKGIVLTVKASGGDEMAKWTLTGDAAKNQKKDLDLAIQPEMSATAAGMVAPTGTTGFDASKATVVTFGDNDSLPAGTTVQAKTTLTSGGYGYHVDANGNMELGSEKTFTVSGGMLTFAPSKTSPWVFSTTRITKNAPPPVTPPTPDNSGNNTYYYGGYGYGYTQSAQESFNSTFTSRMSATARGAIMTIDMADGVTLTAAQLKDAAAKGILIELKKAGKNTITIDPSKMKFSSEKYSFDDLAFLFADVAGGDAVVIAPAPVAPAPVAPAPTPTQNPQTSDNWFTNLFIGLFD